MSAAEKHPELWQEFSILKAEKEAVSAALADYYGEISEIGKQEGVLRERRAQITAENAERLQMMAELDMEIARVAKLMGAKSMREAK